MEEARAWTGADEGLFIAPEAAATVAAAARLARSGWLNPHEEIVLFLTGDGFKYPRAETAA